MRLRAQRVLIYYNNEISLDEAIILSNAYLNALTEKVATIEGACEILNNHKLEEYFIIGDSLKSDVGFEMKCHFDSCCSNRKK